MTFLEKAMQMTSRPTSSKEALVEDWCPHHLKLEPFDERNCNNDCKTCWNREMPDTSDIKVSITPEKIEELKEEELLGPKCYNATGKPGDPYVTKMIEESNRPKILDSGNRREFKTGAVRDIQEGKGRCDLLPLDVVADLYSPGILDYIAAFIDSGETRHLERVLSQCIFDDGIFDNAYDMLLEVSKHFEEGAKKYGEDNWKKGIPTHCYIDSAVRHYLKYFRGDKDEPHDRAFVWNLLCCIWTCKHKPELNDYARPEV